MKPLELFQTPTPKLVNGSSNLSKKDKQNGVITIMRPYRYQNPFAIGMILTIDSVSTALNKLPYFDRHVDKEFLDSNLPILFSKTILHEKVDRTLAITLFKEFWKYVRTKSKLITDDEILKLSNKTLICCCKPKPCHGDVIVDDYELTRIKNENLTRKG